LGGALGQEKTPLLPPYGPGGAFGGGMPQGTQIKRVYLGYPIQNKKIKIKQKTKAKIIKYKKI